MEFRYTNHLYRRIERIFFLILYPVAVVLAFKGSKALSLGVGTVSTMVPAALNMFFNKYRGLSFSIKEKCLEIKWEGRKIVLPWEEMRVVESDIGLRVIIKESKAEFLVSVNLEGYKVFRNMIQEKSIKHKFPFVVLGM